MIIYSSVALAGGEHIPWQCFERLDFSGKNILPLMTHEGSGLGSSVRDLKKICNGGTIKTGLAVHGADAVQSEQIVAAWAKEGVNQ